MISLYNDYSFYLNQLTDSINRINNLLDNPPDEFLPEYIKQKDLHTPNLFKVLESYFSMHFSLSLQKQILEMFIPAFKSEINDPLAITKTEIETVKDDNNNTSHIYKVWFIQNDEQYLCIEPFNYLKYETEDKQLDSINQQIIDLTKESSDLQNQIDTIRDTESDPDKLYDDRKISWGKYMGYLIHGDKLTRDLISRITPMQNKIQENDDRIENLKLDLEKRQQAKVMFAQKVEIITHGCDQIRDRFNDSLSLIN